MTRSNSNGGTPPTEQFLRGPWVPAIRRGVEAMVVGQAGGIAAFDFDDTILDGDISLAVLARLAEQTGRDLVAEYEADCAVDVRAGYATLVETLIAGRTEFEIRALTESVLLDGLASGRLRIRPAVADLIWALQRYGWTVWIVTASPAVMVSVAAQRVGIPADHVLGMWCRAGSDGRFVAPTQEPITYRQGKVDALSAATGGAAPTFAVGDALTDLEMLQWARYALVLDRGNPVLRDEAAARGWWLQGGL